MTIDFDAIETVFLDVGNTMISIDFDLVAAELRARGVACALDDLARAECAARPVLARTPYTDSASALTPFQRYTVGVFDQLQALAVIDRDERRAIALDVAESLRASGGADLVWRRVIPGVPGALARMRELDLTLVVVSNSDGSVERILRTARLLDYFSVVVDSSVVGFEKPDPRIFEHALERAAARASTTVHVGDLYDVDVVGARRAGINAVLLDPFDDWTFVDCPRLPDLTAVAHRLEAARRH